MRQKLVLSVADADSRASTASASLVETVLKLCGIKTPSESPLIAKKAVYSEVESVATVELLETNGEVSQALSTSDYEPITIWL